MGWQHAHTDGDILDIVQANLLARAPQAMLEIQSAPVFFEHT